MRPPSKTPKKYSDEDRSRKKKIKSKSKKSSRRDSSISPYSSSEQEPNSRRKSSRSKKPEKRRRKESKKPEKKRSRKKRYSSSSSDSSQGCSTCSDSKRSRSPIRRSKSKRRKTTLEGIHRSSRSQVPSSSCSTCSEGKAGWSPRPIEESYREKGESARLRSVLAVKKSEEEVDDRYIGNRSSEDRDKIIEAYDDFPSLKNNDKKRQAEDFWSMDRSQPAKICDVVIDDSRVCESESMRKEGIVVDDNNGVKEAEDLESILRQKALENLQKFRGGFSANKESLGDKKDELSKLESNQDAKDFVRILESKPPTSLEDQRYIHQGGGRTTELKARSFVNMPLEKNSETKVRSLSNDSESFKPVARGRPNEFKTRYFVNRPIDNYSENTVRSLSNDSESFKPVATRMGGSSTEGQKTLNQLKRVQESFDKRSSEETSLAKDTQNKRAIAEPGSGKVSRAEVDIVDKSTSEAPCLNTEKENCKSNEPNTESASRSQFEQKTFSRMHDGEMVQVSYKVYIPKKTPALARRQLQR